VSARKILLVDDSSTMLLLEQMVLDSAGAQILMAKDGEAGVRAARAHRPDLILLDAILPKRDASEICRQLRAHAATRDVPILLVIPRGEEKNVERGLLSGCNGSIIKPIDNNELLSRVRSLLGD
jgi:DNA-binding response OmpR family regulator